MCSKKAIVIAGALALVAANITYADETSDLKAKFEALQKQMEALKSQLDSVTAQMQKQQLEQKQMQKAPQAAQPQAQQAQAAPTIKLKDGDGITFEYGANAVSIYGNFDVSLDTTTKGLAGYYPSSGDGPVGKVGYMPAISTNLSYIGVRGKHGLGNGLDFVYQLETQLDISATSGTTNTNSNNDTTVKGALTSRNSYIGLHFPDAGSIKIGKTDAPYKTSTARMNAFSGMLGDYSVVMGNTGGDNRVEFGTRLDHAIWYESPNLSGFTFNALYATAQNRSNDNSLIAVGESSCAGGNAPGSGALPPTCNDGSYGSAYSANIAYQGGSFYVTAAYEMHKDVNRTSDLANLDPNDIGNEHAAKFGVQWTLPTHTTLNAVYEDMKRSVPGYLEYQNERSRTGYWLAVSQMITGQDSVHFGVAHANTTPGDPGQHNTSGGANPDNVANMYTFAYKHAFDKHAMWYFDMAMTKNHRDAHYDLGAGGRAVTTDCHDGSALAAYDPTTGTVTGSGPRCYAGGELKGASVGLKYQF